ncbi:hypothetical protein HD554DRAFT_2079034 [Boletus coccyginus]|nr:hypothetical protein HD554DRAFT_2079034 [Boletus coccyginus]
MIIDSNSNMVSYTDSPPTYEYVAEQGSKDNVRPPGPVDKQQQKVPVQQPPSTPPVVSLHVAPVPVMPQPTVYYYQSPVTGEQLATLSPPDHPEMLCLQRGGHEPRTKYGILGILAAIVWFPLGIGLCLLDRRVQCKRCGVVIDNGICG